jgi:uncharacterized membrane protein YedE/YeeE
MSAAAVTVSQSLAGGALIGAGAAVLMLGSGRVAGISGIATRVLYGGLGEQSWRLAFLAGLVLPALIVGIGPVTLRGSPEVLAIAGLAVGYGTRLGSGCTSGHGVCGLANLSPRSLIATLTFMAAAILTVALRHALAPA